MTKNANQPEKPYDLENTASDVPQIKALRLVTIYGDESTSLVSLAHRVIIADFDGEEPQQGIPHLHLTQEIEQEAGIQYWGEDFKGEEEGFPGWPAIFEYLDARPSLLENEDK